jgi:hypothetical protein
MRTRTALLLLSAAGCAAVSGAPAAGAASPRCTTGDLAGAIIDEDAGAGQRNARLILTNTSSHACHTKGYIGGQLVGASGTAMPTNIVRDHSVTPHRVVIKAGAAGSVRLHWTVVPSGSSPCATAPTLRVTPPDETTSLPVHFGGTACGGRIDVRPVRNARRIGN